MTPHPLNHGFTWRRATGTHRIVTDDQARAYDDQGYLLVEDAFGPEVIDKVVAAIDPLERRQEAWLREQGGTFLISRADEITFTTHLVLESAVLRKFVNATVLVDLCADLIGPDVRLYWDQAVDKKPCTGSTFPWHQDNGYAFIEPQQYLTWIALSAVDEENGCSGVVPSAHLHGTLAHEVTPHGLVCLDRSRRGGTGAARRGSVVVFSSLTPHCTGANRTERVRKAYIVQFAPDGAEVLHVNGKGAVTRVAARHPGRQFPVLTHGQPVSA